VDSVTALIGFAIGVVCGMVVLLVALAVVSSDNINERNERG